MWLIVHDRLQMDRPAPDGLYVCQRVGRLVQLQVEPVMLVPQEQFAAVAVVAVHHVNPRFAEVGQAEQEPLLNLSKLPRLDDVILALLVVVERKKLMLLTKLRRQEGVDKGNIVMDAANLEDFFAAQAELLVP